ncbi:MAG TPA: competence protein ComEA [Acholeplasmataceae bacterium]|jgi:competence protein ComEA|nr:competence protein ComEA [Acholeplasmataceae bacterium]
MNKRNIIIAVVVVVLIILGIVWNNQKQVETLPNDYLKNPNDFTRTSQIVVDVKGEVKAPGIYYLDLNSRVIDAINAAGGVTPLADMEKINLATKLEDGMIVNIFPKKEELNKKISINTASIEELMKLPGVGEAKAKSIINHRTKYGYFMSLEELIKVEGINENLFKQIKEFICL